MTFKYQKQMQDALDEHFATSGADSGADQFVETVEKDGNIFVVSTTNGCIVGEEKGQQRLVFDQYSEKFKVV